MAESAFLSVPELPLLVVPPAPSHHGRPRVAVRRTRSVPVDRPSTCDPCPQPPLTPPGRRGASTAAGWPHPFARPAGSPLPSAPPPARLTGWPHPPARSACPSERAGQADSAVRPPSGGALSTSPPRSAPPPTHRRTRAQPRASRPPAVHRSATVHVPAGRAPSHGSHRSPFLG